MLLIHFDHVVIQNYLSSRMSLTPISSAKYLPVSFFVEGAIMHLHNSLSMRPSLGISEEEFHLSLFASVVSLSPLQKRLILRLALGRGLALLVRVGA